MSRRLIISRYESFYVSFVIPFLFILCIMLSPLKRNAYEFSYSLNAFVEHVSWSFMINERINEQEIENFNKKFD